MDAKKFGLLVLAIITLASLGGCASTGRQVNKQGSVSKKTMMEAQAYIDSTRNTNSILYKLSVAVGSECTESDGLFRPPFSLFFNHPKITSDEMRTAIYQTSGANEFPVLQTHTADLSAYDGQRMKSMNQVPSNNIGPTLTAVLSAAAANKNLEITLEDGRVISTHAIAACPSYVETDYFGNMKDVWNFAIVEVAPKSWLALATNDDERAFILARAIYFTGAEGRAKLRNARYMGAVVSGVVHGLTMGIGNLVVDPKTMALKIRRKANRKEADAFAIRAMRAAGFDPRAALALATRSFDAGNAWPEDAADLQFDQGRLIQLKASIN